MRKGSRNRVIESNKLNVENKTIWVDLKENEGGRFIQIAEISNDRRSMVIIPETGLAPFLQVVKKMVEIYQLAD